LIKCASATAPITRITNGLVCGAVAVEVEAEDVSERAMK